MHHKSSFFGDKFTYILTTFCTMTFIFFVLMILGSLVYNSRKSIKKFSFSFITQSNWNAKTLKLLRVSIKDDSFMLIFSTSINKNKIADYISLHSNSSPISYSFKVIDRFLYMIPEEKITNKIYSIVINPKFSDKDHNVFNKKLVWSGTVTNKKEIINISISGDNISLYEDKEEKHFGILAFIVGTLLSSIIALLISFPISLATALFLTEYSSQNSQFTKIFSILIDLLAGIPSVVYGLWGLFFLVPYIGANLLTASLVLAIMTIPYTTSLIKESILLVPHALIKSGLGLGATKYKIITIIILPYAMSGIIASILLTLGRSLGETLAVSMVIGNRNQIPKSLFDPAQTIASLIINEYGEATALKQSCLIEAGLILIIITMFFSLLGRLIIRMKSTKYLNRKN